MPGSSITIEGPVEPGRAAGACEQILRALPDWFGIEAAITHYIQAAGELPTWLAVWDGAPVGFLTIKQHFATAAEIYVMGVLPGHQGRGAGKRLVWAIEEHLRGQGVKFLQVKTLSPAHPDPFYARTRAFYLSTGFTPLEEFKELWGVDNPCLQLVKTL